MKKFKVLLIGLGRIATTLENDSLRYKPCTHAGAILCDYGRKHFLLSGVFDSDAGQYDRFMGQWPEIPEPAVGIHHGYDLAVIASNSDSHYENALQVIDAGIRAMVIEKPVTLTRQEALHLLELKKRHNLKIWVNHERRYHPVYRMARQIFKNHQYGDLKTIRAAVLTAPLKMNGRENISPLLHDGTHAVDFIHWLVGKPREVISRSYRSDPGLPVPDRTVAFMEFGGDINVFLEAGGMRNYFQFEIDLQFTGGRIILSNDGSRFFRSEKSELYENFNSLQEIQAGITGNENPFVNLYREVAENLAGNSDYITGSIEDNLEIMEIMESLL